MLGPAGYMVAHVILVSALGPNPSFSFFGGLLFNFGACWDRGLDLDLDQGLTIMLSIILLVMLMVGTDAYNNTVPEWIDLECEVCRRRLLTFFLFLFPF